MEDNLEFKNQMDKVFDENKEQLEELLKLKNEVDALKADIENKEKELNENPTMIGLLYDVQREEIEKVKRELQGKQNEYEAKIKSLESRIDIRELRLAVSSKMSGFILKSSLEDRELTLNNSDTKKDEVFKFQNVLELSEKEVVRLEVAIHDKDEEKEELEEKISNAREEINELTEKLSEGIKSEDSKDILDRLGLLSNDIAMWKEQIVEIEKDISLNESFLNELLDAMDNYKLVEDNIPEYTQLVGFSNILKMAQEDLDRIEDAKKKADEEAKKKADEEAKKKADEEAKKKAEEDAKKKAEEDAKKKAEEDAKKKAEEDAKKKAEEDAKKKPEDDGKKKENDNKPDPIVETMKNVEFYNRFEGLKKKANELAFLSPNEIDEMFDNIAYMYENMYGDKANYTKEDKMPKEYEAALNEILDDLMSAIQLRDEAFNKFDKHNPKHRKIIRANEFFKEMTNDLFIKYFGDVNDPEKVEEEKETDEVLGTLAEETVVDEVLEPSAEETVVDEVLEPSDDGIVVDEILEPSAEGTDVIVEDEKKDSTIEDGKTEFDKTLEKLSEYMKEIDTYGEEDKIDEYIEDIRSSFEDPEFSKKATESNKIYVKMKELYDKLFDVSSVFIENLSKEEIADKQAYLEILMLKVLSYFSAKVDSEKGKSITDKDAARNAVETLYDLWEQKEFESVGPNTAPEKIVDSESRVVGKSMAEWIKSFRSEDGFKKDSESSVNANEGMLSISLDKKTLLENMDYQNISASDLLDIISSQKTFDTGMVNICANLMRGFDIDKFEKPKIEREIEKKVESEKETYLDSDDLSGRGSEDDDKKLDSDSELTNDEKKKKMEKLLEDSKKILYDINPVGKYNEPYIDAGILRIGNLYDVEGSIDRNELENKLGVFDTIVKATSNPDEKKVAELMLKKKQIEDAFYADKTIVDDKKIEKEAEEVSTDSLPPLFLKFLEYQAKEAAIKDAEEFLELKRKPKKYTAKKGFFDKLKEKAQKFAKGVRKNYLLYTAARSQKDEDDNRRGIRSSLKLLKNPAEKQALYKEVVEHLKEDIAGIKKGEAPKTKFMERAIHRQYGKLEGYRLDDQYMLATALTSGERGYERKDEILKKALDMITGVKKTGKSNFAIALKKGDYYFEKEEKKVVETDDEVHKIRLDDVLAELKNVQSKNNNEKEEYKKAREDKEKADEGR